MPYDIIQLIYKDYYDISVNSCFRYEDRRCFRSTIVQTSAQLIQIVKYAYEQD